MTLNTISLVKNQYYLIILILLFPVFLKAQQGSKIVQLLDQADKTPLAGVTYQYQTQKGISDEQGRITLNFIESETLYLSHISYGQWSLTSQQVGDALKKGMYYLRKTAVNIQPVTIIALRPKTNEKETLALSNQDRLAHDGGAILNRTPAINSIRKSGSYGFDPVLRGFKYDQVNVVINGCQSANAACPNRMDPATSQIAPNMMERIEILKGPHSLRYGNSFGGTINFISTAPRFSDDKDIYGRLSGNFESNGNVIRTEGLLGFSGEKYDLGLFASWSQGEDYKDGEGVSIPSEFLRGSFGANLGLKLAKNQQLVVSATRNVARDSEFPALPMDLRKDDTWLLNARHEFNIGNERLKSWKTMFYGTFVDHLMDNLEKNMNPRMMNAQTDAITRTYGGRTEGVWKPGKGMFFAGADLRVEEADGEREREFLMGPNSGKILYDNVWQQGRISHSGLFAEYHFPYKNFRFVFSGRMELNVGSISDGKSEFTDVYSETDVTQLNPSVSVGGINNFSNGFSLGLWFGRAQRSGGLTERYINYFPVGLDPYELVGNPNLIPEVNNQLDLTFGYKTAGTSIDVGLFASFLRDYISSEINDDLEPRLPNRPGVRQFVNIDEAFMTGFEVSWNQKLFGGLQHLMTMAYTYGQDQVMEDPLPEIAPLDFRYILTGSYLKEKFHPELSFRYVTQQDRISTIYGETETPSFALVDLDATYRFNKVLSVAAGVHNLFDEAYYEHLNRSVQGNVTRSIYAPGRNIFFSVVLNLM